MEFFVFLAVLVVDFVFDLIKAAFVVWLFNIIGIPVLAALTFWQVFGLLIVASIATHKVSTGS